MPVVTFLGAERMIFCDFLRPMPNMEVIAYFNYNFYAHIPIWRGEGDLNPRVFSDMGLAIPRPTRLGDLRSTRVVFVANKSLKSWQLFASYS